MTPGERDKLVRVLGMLGSTHDGERAAAGRLATKLLKTAGRTWDEVVIDNSRPAATAAGSEITRRTSAMAVCAGHQSALTEWEARFLASIRRRRTLTERQMATLLKIATELPGRGTP